MKQKILSIFLLISLVANIGLVIYIHRSNSDVAQQKLSNISSADVAVDNALNYSGQIVRQWNDLSDSEIIHYLNQVDKELMTAMILLNEAESYFAPLKEFSQHDRMFAQKILSEHKNEDIYRAYQNEYQSLQHLWVF